jgi:hypothetical protein
VAHAPDKHLRAHREHGDILRAALKTILQILPFGPQRAHQHRYLQIP